MSDERCDECDPSFDCFTDGERCRKQPLTLSEVPEPSAELAAVTDVNPIDELTKILAPTQSNPIESVITMPGIVDAEAAERLAQRELDARSRVFKVPADVKPGPTVSFPPPTTMTMPGIDLDAFAKVAEALSSEGLDAAASLVDDSALPDDVVETNTLDSDPRIGEYHVPPSERDRMRDWQEMILKELVTGHTDGKVIADDITTSDRVLGMVQISAARVLEYALNNPAIADQLVHDIVICALAAGHYANADEQSTPKGRQARRLRKLT